MTRHEITDLFARMRDALASRDSVAIAANYAEDCLIESPTYGAITGRSSVQKSFHAWFATFPDSTIEFGDLLITGQQVVQPATVRGTDTGGLLGQAPTGNQFRLFVVQLFDVAGGQIVHERRVFDMNGLLLQLATGRDLPAETPHLYRTALARVRLEHELKIAGDIQRALLPAPHYKGSGFEVAARSLPCRAIGGDFLDYFDLPNNAFGFVLGDVAGKGPPAALLAAKLQGILAVFSNSARAPSETLMHANDELVRRTVESRFATLVYGVVSCDGRLTYCNAGHNPPLIIGSRGVRRLEKGGLILGAFKDVCFEDETVQFHTGDVLVVFSDGVTDALNADGAEFGEEHVLSAIQPDRDSVQNILEDILSAVHEFSAGVEQNDDVTALVLRYTGS